MRLLESVQGRLIKQSIGLSKLSQNTALLKALNIEKIEDIVNRNVLSLYNRIFKVESPARRLMQHLLSRFILYGETVPTQYTLSFIYYNIPLYVLLLLILFIQVFIIHRVSFICVCTYECVCNVSSSATEAK